MTGLDKLAQAVAAMTPGPWRYAQLLDGIEARALIDSRGYHFGQSDDLENGIGLAMLRNCAEELIAVAKAAKKAAIEIDSFYQNADLCAGTFTISEDHHDLWFHRDEIDVALATLEAKLEGT